MVHMLSVKKTIISYISKPCQYFLVVLGDQLANAPGENLSNLVVQTVELACLRMPNVGFFRHFKMAFAKSVKPLLGTLKT